MSFRLNSSRAKFKWSSGAVKAEMQLSVHTAEGCVNHRKIIKKLVFSFPWTSAELCKAAPSLSIRYLQNATRYLRRKRPNLAYGILKQQYPVHAATPKPPSTHRKPPSKFLFCTQRPLQRETQSVITVGDGSYNSLLCGGSIGDKNYTIYICTIC